MAEQEKFQEQDRVYDVGDLIGRIVTFVNIYDGGYCAKRAAWLAGKQHALQPPSARSDERFRDRTHDRSGNEGAVDVCKRSGSFKRGFLTSCGGPGVSRLTLCINLSSRLFNPLLLR